MSTPAEHQWDRYDRDRLPRGWSFVLGRDAVEAALRASHVRVGFLSLSAPDPPREEPYTLLDISWRSTAVSGHGDVHGPEAASHLLFGVGAVPAESRGAIRDELAVRMLPRACLWCAQALARADAPWGASDHRFLVSLRHGRVSASEDPAGRVP